MVKRIIVIINSYRIIGKGRKKWKSMCNFVESETYDWYQRNIYFCILNKQAKNITCT